MMPSPYTADMSLEDARAEAQALRKAFPERTGAQPTADEMEGKFIDEETGEIVVGPCCASFDPRTNADQFIDVLVWLRNDPKHCGQLEAIAVADYSMDRQQFIDAVVTAAERAV